MGNKNEKWALRVNSLDIEPTALDDVKKVTKWEETQ